MKKETDTDCHFLIESICLSGTELEQDYARFCIVFSKGENIKPRVSISSSVDECRWYLFADGMSSHVGDLYVRRSLGVIFRKFEMIRTGVCVAMLYRWGGGKDRDFDKASVLFCFEQKSESPENVSISVDSDVPVFFKGIFRSATTNNPANKELFSAYEQLVLSYFGYDLGIKEDEENLTIKDGTIKSKEERREWMKKRILAYSLLGLQEKTKQTKQTTSERIKALFEADWARREKDPEREKGRRMREKAAINTRNRIRELIRMDLESRKIKEGNKIEKNEIILEEPKVEDKKEEKLFNKSSKEDYFKGFDAFKDKLNAEFKAHFEKENSWKNEIKIGDKKSKEPEIFKSEDCFGFPESRFEFSEVMNSKPIKIEYKEERDKESFEEEEDEKEDVKIGQSEINFEKSPVESICNESSENSEKSEHRGKLLKYTSDSDDE